MSLIEDYIDVVHEETGMWAVYPPSLNVELGDYGTVEDGQFRRLGNVRQFSSCHFEEQMRGQGLSREYKSKRVRKVAMGAGAKIDAGIVTAHPALELSFATDFSVYFAVAGCSNWQITNLQALSEQIVALYREDRWKKEWRLITSIFKATNLTVVISKESESKLVLEASADVPRIDMADANLSLHVLFDSSSSDQWITEKPRDGQDPFTPFYWAHRLTTNIFGRNPSLEGLEAAALPASEEPLALALAERTRDPLDGWRRS
ncbi:MAG: hypothetical protein Q8S73_44290 [Deltaproteobacteria bacterium]|nr:hypothetical protein [Myxococcales bacterium]MDP3221185.1 hypothetical protein [Deltaproteobacteria bacterium]